MRAELEKPVAAESPAASPAASPTSSPAPSPLVSPGAPPVSAPPIEVSSVVLRQPAFWITGVVVLGVVYWFWIR
jgi:hypothetical protein